MTDYSRICPTCHGHGKTPRFDYRTKGFGSEYGPCPRCAGTGRLPTPPLTKEDDERIS